MQTSGPIRKGINLRHYNDCGEFVHYSGNFYEAVIDGKRCLLKTARHAGVEAKVLLKREYDLSCRLQHPFILSPLRFIDTPKGPAIVMDYVDGCTLTEFLKRKPSYAVRVRILNEILDAVEYLHMSGILHNDLKPDNVLIDSIGGHIKIIDFGLAEKASEYLTKRLGGTFRYSAPEVLIGDINTPSTAAADVYSLGRIISDMFPGKFRLIVRKSIKDEPWERFQSVSAVRQALKSAKAARLCLLVCFLCLATLAFVRGCDSQSRSALGQQENGASIQSDEPQDDLPRRRNTDSKSQSGLDQQENRSFVQSDEPQCDLSLLRYKVTKPMCDVYAIVNGQRGIMLGFKMIVSESVDTTIKVVIPLFSAKTQPFPSVDKYYTYRAQCAIIGDVNLKHKKQNLTFFIPFKSIPKMPAFPSDAWSRFREEIGVLSYAIQFRVLLVDKNETSIYQSDIQKVSFDRLSDYDMIYK